MSTGKLLNLNNPSKVVLDYIAPVKTHSTPLQAERTSKKDHLMMLYQIMKEPMSNVNQ